MKTYMENLSNNIHSVAKKKDTGKHFNNYLIAYNKALYSYAPRGSVYQRLLKLEISNFSRLGEYWNREELTLDTGENKYE